MVDVIWLDGGGVSASGDEPGGLGEEVEGSGDGIGGFGEQVDRSLCEDIAIEASLGDVPVLARRISRTPVAESEA